MRRNLALAIVMGSCTLGVGCLERFTSKSTVIELPKGAEPSARAAERVDQVGRTIMAANVFSGIDPSFQTIGSKERILLHRGQESIFISDSLVEECNTDAELAALLCSELGKMLAEKRNAVRMGYRDPLMDITITNSGESGGITADQFRLAELAMHEQQMPKRAVDRARAEITDPRRLAIEMLKTGGYDEKQYADAEQMLKGVNTNREMVRQLSGTSLMPSWTR
jgi:hypothetical protein